MVDPRLIEILACPACDDRPPVRLVDDGLECESCGRIYPIRDDIPEMLVESARLPEGLGRSETKSEAAAQP
jgi:uncharacterized protein YbaR (Trm112 family)